MTTEENNISEAIGKELQKLVAANKSSLPALTFAAGLGSLLPVLAIIFTSGNLVGQVNDNEEDIRNTVERVRIVESKMYRIDRMCEDISDVRRKFDKVFYKIQGAPED